jgi:hypothetical protein
MPLWGPQSYLPLFFWHGLLGLWSQEGTVILTVHSKLCAVYMNTPHIKKLNMYYICYYKNWMYLLCIKCMFGFMFYDR